MTLSICYILNFLFLDQFYIYRKKENMKKIVAEVKKIRNKPEELEDYLEELKQRESMVVVFLDKHGREIGTGMHKRMMRKALDMRMMELNGELQQRFFFVSAPSPSSGRILIYNDKLPDGTWISLRASLLSVDTYKYEMYLFSIITSIITLILTAYLGKVFSKKITSDIEKLNLAAYDIADLKFIDNIGIDRDDEIGELSRNIETMSKKLNISMESMKNFVSNASHELKTPIAIISTHAQGLLKKSVVEESERKDYYETILRTSYEMGELISNLLTISRINSLDYVLDEDDVDIEKLIKQSLEKYEFIELENDIQVIIKIKDKNLIVDRNILKLAIDNIVLNGLKYSPYEGKFEIIEIDGKFSFKNSLQNMMPIDIEKIWEPFARGQNAFESGVDGTGLGLSIVKRALELNNMDFGIEVDNESFEIWFKQKK